jgi:hypothetical protein
VSPVCQFDGSGDLTPSPDRGWAFPWLGDVRQPMLPKSGRVGGTLEGGFIIGPGGRFGSVAGSYRHHHIVNDAVSGWLYRTRWPLGCRVAGPNLRMRVWCGHFSPSGGAPWRTLRTENTGRQGFEDEHRVQPRAANRDVIPSNMQHTLDGIRGRIRIWKGDSRSAAPAYRRGAFSVKRVENAA